MTPYSLSPIGIVRSPFKEKFGIPRQPGLATSIPARIELLPPYDVPEAFRGLDECSHIWVIFIFSATASQGWKAMVRPPRLGGNRRLGVFATRSTFRPNPIGLSVVRFEGIRQDSNGLWLEVSGADLMDGTPVLDIKPYLPYADSISDATFTLAPEAEQLNLPVEFSDEAQQQCAYFSQTLGQSLQQQISEVLRCDPRPAYKRTEEERIYGITLHNLNIRWQISLSSIIVLSIAPEPDAVL
ncbi:tRNA (N6-threonylcarbamoyladenosine(37)-N6)-methyltransferase TrmO [Nitrincola alkalilacustris]|uniref:tRNA (N6-threonylcarbamoyladenosine(37)-N6)-methyltransferase TrmO n=1 Tax=Nitrincola alkalilacustris TaxID=1571224 RepID=UPI00124D3795|nr:tRNA (N6-threonylcarbamoyladenosine(37)-N6)-methyltransferase TrmO [Nitrincola alkalilacustris]